MVNETDALRGNPFKENIDNTVQRYIKQIMSNKDHFVARFLDETKLKPSECELVEWRKSATETVWFCRNKTEFSLDKSL